MAARPLTHYLLRCIGPMDDDDVDVSDFDDAYTAAFTTQDVFNDAIAPVLLEGGDGGSPANRAALVCSGACADDLLHPVDGYLIRLLSPLVASTCKGDGVVSVSVVDVLDGAVLDYLDGRQKIKPRDKSMFKVAQSLTFGSGGGELEAVRLCAQLHRRQSLSPGTMVAEVRAGDATLYVVNVRSAPSPWMAAIMSRRGGGSGEALAIDPEDIVSCQLGKTLKKAPIVAIHHLDLPSAATATSTAHRRLAATAERSLCNLIANRRPSAATATLLWHVAHQRLAEHRQRLVAGASGLLPPDDDDRLVEELTSDTKRCKKARLHAEEARDKLKEAVAKVPAPTTVTAVNSSFDHTLTAEEKAAVVDATADAQDRGRHTVVHEFHRHCRGLLPLHEAVVAEMKASERALASMRKDPPSAATLRLIDDVVHFTVERAALVAEGVIGPGESFAWIDVAGSSTRPRVSASWNRPLQTTPAQVFPKVRVEFEEVTVVDSDEDVSAGGNGGGAAAGTGGLSRNGHQGVVGPSPAMVGGTGSTAAAAGTAAKDTGRRSSRSSTPIEVKNGLGRATPDLLPQPTSASSAPPAPASSGGGADTAAVTASTTAGAVAAAPSGTAANAQPANVQKEPKVKKPAITKKHDTEEADKKYLMAVYDSPTLVQDVTKYLKAGTIMIKHGRSGSPHPRMFWIATVAFKLELMWVDPDKKSNGAKASISMNDIVAIALGPFGKVFKRHPIANTTKEFFLSFSLHLRDGSRTLDVVAPTLPDFEAWVLGLAHIARVDPHWGKPLSLAAVAAADPAAVADLTPAEKQLCEVHYIAPADYKAVRQKVQGIRDEVYQHMRLFGNNAEHAFAALGGIHLPSVNAKGAILMTKGELRHHCSPFNIDIFRVCEIWRVLSSVDIIYDPNYVATTSFGVTHRK